MIMALFVKFRNMNLRKIFFSIIQQASNKTWKQIGLETNIPRSSLDSYKGKQAIPEETFHKLENYLDAASKSKFRRNLIIVDSKGWLSLGGKNAYSKNAEKFRKGRIKGMRAIKRMGNKTKTYNFLDFVLSKEICEFIGAFIGDGFFNCYNNKLYQIEFSGDKRFDEDYYTKVIIPIIKKEIPELNPRISFVKNKNTLKVRLFSKKLFCFLKQEFGFQPGVKTYDVRIPKRIMDAGDEFINRTIRGIFDTDGTVFFDKRKKYKLPYPRICLQIVSEPLYNQLKDYLRGKFKMRTGNYKNRGIYYIEVYGFENLKKWMSEIGFSNNRHLNKLPQ